VAAKLLDGSAVAKLVRAEVAEAVARLRAERGVVPGLAVVLVGEDPASITYTQMKKKASAAAGMNSEVYTLPSDSTQAQVMSLIDRLNEDPAVHGILVQHPVPRHLDEIEILCRVSPEKDVDGISAVSLGRLVIGRPKFVAATPSGIVELLDRYGIPIEGQEAVIIGRSIILGKPAALLFLQRNATVTVCHTRTRDLPAVTRRADIVVAAAGRAEMVKGDWIKPGAVVVDAGYNRVEGRATDVGDVEFNSASKVASWITPVPGGVGPMTIAMLLKNTLAAAEASG